MSADEMKGAISSVISGMTSLDLISDEQRSALQKSVGALEIFCGGTQMIIAAKALAEVTGSVQTAIAAAQTSAYAMSLVGLANITLATTVAVGVGVGMYAILDTVIEGNLDDSVDRSRINSQVEALYE